MINPNILTLGQSASGSVTISTSLTGGSAPQTVNLTLTGIPGNASYGFSPSQIQSGQTSLLTINTNNANTGSYTLTVTATGTLTTHTNTFTLVITSSDFTI